MTTPTTGGKFGLGSRKCGIISTNTGGRGRGHKRQGGRSGARDGRGDKNQVLFNKVDISYMTWYYTGADLDKLSREFKSKNLEIKS